MSRADRMQTERIRGFPPIAARGARVLVLGSMPSVASLAASQYYAHPRKQFWPMAGAILGFDPGAPYATRQAALRDSGIALWDVLASCDRVGSLDSAIDDDTIQVNDFAGFLASYSRIARVCFNGRKAESAWRLHVSLRLPAGRRFEYRLLPSSSPAHAGMSYRRKLGIWRSALQC